MATQNHIHYSQTTEDSSSESRLCILNMHHYFKAQKNSELQLWNPVSK